MRSTSDIVIAQLNRLKDPVRPITADELHRIVDEAIAEIEHLRSLAGAVSSGPDLADIKQGVGRPNKA